MSTQGKVIPGFGGELVTPLTFMCVLATMTWMVVGGFTVALKSPYLIPVIPFLGIGCMACCIGALTAALREPPQGSFIPLPAQVFGWMGGAFGVAFILWTMGRPAEERAGTEISLIGIVLSGIAVLGIVALIVLPIFLLFTTGESPATEPRHEAAPHSSKTTLNTRQRRGTSEETTRNVA